jgi:hypothetical protein
MNKIKKRYLINNRKPNFVFDKDDLLAYIKTPAAKKLKFLEEAARFFYKFTPPKNKRAWAKLKKLGY